MLYFVLLVSCGRWCSLFISSRCLQCVIVVIPDHTQWRNQYAQKVTHIKGRLLDQAMILFNCVPFQNGNFSKEQFHMA